MQYNVVKALCIFNLLSDKIKNLHISDKMNVNNTVSIGTKTEPRDKYYKVVFLFSHV